MLRNGVMLCHVLEIFHINDPLRMGCIPMIPINHNTKSAPCPREEPSHGVIALDEGRFVSKLGHQIGGRWHEHWWTMGCTEVPHFCAIPKSDCCRPCPTRSHIKITTWKKASLIATGLRLRLVEAVSYSLTQQLQQCNGQDPPGNRATRKMMRQKSATLTNQNTDAQILKCLAIASSPNTMVIQC